MTNCLNGCYVKDGEEIDGQEFRVETLKEFVALLKPKKELHLNYFDNGDDLDIWLRVV